MEPLPPIPTPGTQKWREFRIQVLPLLVFVVTLIAIVILWRNFVQPAGIVGEVEAIKANVISLQDGVIAELNVDRFQTVTNGQKLGKVTVSDPEFLQASLLAIKADLEVLRARMKIDVLRNQQSYHQLRMDLLSAKVAREIATAQLTLASNNFARTKNLYDLKIDSKFELDIDQSSMEVFLNEIRVRDAMIKDLEENIQKLEHTPTTNGEPDPIELAIKAKEAELEQTLKPTNLKAPMDGVVSMVYRRGSERVVRGEPILTISSPMSTRIVGYVRQPVFTMPTTNDTVVVRTRSQKRLVAEGQIVKVGAQFEPINPALISTDSNRIEMGLPIMVALPSGLSVLPGEYVDLSLRIAKR